MPTSSRADVKLPSPANIAARPGLLDRGSGTGGCHRRDQNPGKPVGSSMPLAPPLVPGRTRALTDLWFWLSPRDLIQIEPESRVRADYLGTARR
jgi:hypothetical protein